MPQDNNCNGYTDEMWGVGLKCGTDRGECSYGVVKCKPNGRGVFCDGGVGKSAEICDGLDNVRLRASKLLF